MLRAPTLIDIDNRTEQLRKHNRSDEKYQQGAQVDPKAQPVGNDILCRRNGENSLYV